MQWTQKFSWFLLLALSLCGWSALTFAQPPEAGTRYRTAPKVPPGLVYVSQKIDLRQQLSAEETVFSLDGEPIPQLYTTSVTLGLLLDQEGHVVTRLANFPGTSAPQLMIYPASERGGQFRAELVGMDSVTGFCVLKIENLPPSYTRVAISNTTTPTSTALQRTVQIFGFNPKQRGSGSPGVLLIRPRLFHSIGSIKKATTDFRFTPSNPIFHLTAPTNLTSVQDCSVAFEKDGSVVGLIAYDTTGEEQHLVYPLARIQQLATMVIAHKRSVVPHAWLGAVSEGRNLTAKVGTPERLKESERGVLIAKVFPDSPAEMAGVRPYDTLVSISGRALTTGADLSSTLRLLPADSEVILKVRRGTELKSLLARLAPAPALDAQQHYNWMVNRLEDYEKRAKELPETDPNRAKNASKAAAMRSILEGIINPAPPEIWLRIMYGLEPTELTPQLAKHFTVPGGVLIATLNSSGKLALAGAKVGDVIVKVGEQAIGDTGSLMQALSTEKADPMEILLVRNGQQVQLTIAK